MECQRRRGVEWAYHETFFNFFGQKGVDIVGFCEIKSDASMVGMSGLMVLKAEL